MAPGRTRRHASQRSERGFTLVEVLTTIVILGILVAIAISVWNNVIESRRVDSAANQLASDLRLAHTRATNQLTDWRVVVILGREGEGEGADYYLTKLDGPYPSNPVNVTDTQPRTFPGDVKATASYKDQDDSDYPTGYANLEPVSSSTPSTLTFEFNSDGSAWTYPAVSGSACVTVDGEPILKDRVLAATSNVEIQDASC